MSEPTPDAVTDTAPEATHVIIAEVASYAQAEAAIAYFNNVGIDAELYEPEGGSADGLARIIVPADQVEDAKRVIAGEPPVFEDGWEQSAEAAVEGWLCLSCDTEVAKDEAVCPMCGALRQGEAEGD